MQTIDINVQGIDNSINAKFDTLNELVYNNTPEYKNEKIIEAFSEKLIYYKIRSLIYSAKYIKTKSIYDGNHIYNVEDIKSIIQRKFTFNENISITNIANILKEIIDNIDNNKIKGKLTKPKSHKGSLHRYALENNLRCYICGSELEYHNTEAENYREFEHFIPVSLGGNKNTQNIFIACKRCNKAKKNYINWIESDFHLKHPIFINIEKDTIPVIEDDTEKELRYEEEMGKKITDELLFMVSSLCEYKCSMCETDNDISNNSTFAPKKSINSMPIYIR